MRFDSGFIQMTIPTATSQAKGYAFDRATGRPVVFTPDHVRSAQDVWRAALRPFRATLPQSPILGAVKLSVDLRFAYLRNAKKEIVKTGTVVPKLTRPDLDNLGKLLIDCMSSLGFWADDAQVSQLYLRKVFAPVGGVYIRIETEESAARAAVPGLSGEPEIIELF